MGLKKKLGLDKIKKGVKKFIRPSLEIGADFVKAAGGYLGMPEVGNRLGNMLEPGDTAATNAQKRADFEYARSLADQRAFQDDSIQRRIADARAAGIHPLAALGFQSPSFIPPQTDSGYSQGDDYGMAAMGQDIGRAVAAGQTEKERRATMAMQSVVDNLAIKRMQLENQGLVLENQYRLSRLVRLREGVGPGFPATNKIRQVGLDELSSLDPTAASKTFTHEGQQYDLNAAEVAQGMENDPIAMAVHMNYRWLNPLGRRIADELGNFKIDNTHSIDYVGRRRRPYRVKNRVRGSRISSYHTQ